MAKRNQRYPQDVPASVEGKQVKLKTRIVPKNYAQEMYIESLKNNPITIANGPAGSAKTWLATGIALEKLLSNQVSKIILTRPVVEAEGENLGFLPGTLEQKLDPYLKPLFDAIEEFVGPMMAKKLIETGKIEIAPLAYMRGRTFNYSYVILDEAQNSTTGQMKLFVTRIGEGSTYAINGDLGQCDIKEPRDYNRSQGPWENGLQYAIRKLSTKDPDIQYCQFYQSDVVRSDLCKKVVALIETPDNGRNASEQTQLSPQSTRFTRRPASLLGAAPVTE